MAAGERLELGLLVGADDELIGAQPAPLEPTRVQVEHAAGLDGEVRVTDKLDQRGLELDGVVITGRIEHADVSIERPGAVGWSGHPPISPAS